MAQAFSFGFQNDDMEDDSGDTRTAAEEPSNSPTPHQDNLASPRLHTLEQMFSRLPERIEYGSTEFTTNSPQTPLVILPRRELFDIRVQLMRDAGRTAEPSQIANTALSGGDLDPGVYEGGFKTWECSIDLAAYLIAAVDGGQIDLVGRDLHVVELGAGTALPSRALLHHVVFQRSGFDRPSSTRITVADYNELVLALATLPNILLTCGLTDHADLSANSTADVEVETYLLKATLKRLADANTHVQTISGAWGPAFEEICDFPRPAHVGASFPPCTVLFLASETIYSPTSTAAFAQTLLALMRKAIVQNAATCVALVAAKRIYFGVGGGTDEFLSTVTEKGAEVKTVWSSAVSPSGGVCRLILEVTLSQRLGAALGLA